MPSIRVAVLLAVALAAQVAPTVAMPNAQRLFLLGASTDASAWYGPDAADPELAAETISCSSNPDNGERGCPLEPNRAFAIWLTPRLLLNEPVTWSAGAPLRFHIEMSAIGATVENVRLVVQTGGSAPTSPPATEVAPGVFEGTMPLGSPMNHAVISLLGINVSLSGIASSVAVRAGGASWVDLPTPVDAAGIPELIAGDTHRPAPSIVNIGERTFTFNDEHHQTWTFDETLSGTRTHQLDLAAPASAVFAWVESFSTPYVYALLNGDAADERKLSQFPYLRLVAGGAQLDARERGVAAASVPAGPLSIEVIRKNLHSSTAGTEGAPYRLHVVAAYGERTVAAMQWPLPQARWTVAKTPVVAECPYDSESVPQPARAPTFALELSWSGPAAASQRWTFSFDLPGAGFVPCGEMFTGRTLRLTLPGARLWAFSPTPADGTFVAAQDTRFEMTVRYTYDAP